MVCDPLRMEIDRSILTVNSWKNAGFSMASPSDGISRPVNGTGWAWASVVQSRPENRTGLLGVAQSRP